MSSTCHTCKYRNEAVTYWPSTPSQLDVCIVTLNFKIQITQTQTESHIALNTLLNNIIDNADSLPRPSAFTVWSPCLSDPRTVVIVTTGSGLYSTSTPPAFNVVKEYLAAPPIVQQVYLDLDVTSLATTTPEHRVPCEMIQLHAPNSGVAAAIGKQFGWNPKRSSLSSQLQKNTTAAFSRPGDLVREFRAWAEVSHGRSRSPSQSTGSSALSSPSVLSLHGDQHETLHSTSAPYDSEQVENLDEETLIMIFQWTSHSDADRFKNHNQRSYGANGEQVPSDLWDREVAYPFEQLQRLGAKADSYRLDLRAVEPRIRTGEDASPQLAAGQKSRIRRLSIMASGIGEKVSGLWR
ncbi:hypothetical protein N0V83_008765 [Neocucurbitaria cava]|uniref:Uncharacterized protein n=1 Tax=Neocucurbitaria cava TaxID=798079 RepID=A0A9W9CJ31_9PLEO|nr:hypothetical protein N0V83_008765 [Neocucurbitaria cava]